jgi:hypothetical protein
MKRRFTDRLKQRQYLAVVTSWLVLSIAGTLSASTMTLDFNAPVPGTLNDANGSGTGFTTRLPGTGSAIPTNDPNMNLASSPGRLLLTTTHAAFPNPTALNPSNLEAPAIFVPGVGTGDIFVTATFDNVHVPDGSDQLMVYAGIDINNTFRAGIHEQNVFMETVNQGSDLNTFSGLGAFSSGDNLEITLSRQSGQWAESWNNLTTSTSGSLPSVALPWLDAASGLYFGIDAANAGTTTSFLATIDNFSITVVPEPAALVLGLFAAAGLAVTALRRRRC